MKMENNYNALTELGYDVRPLKSEGKLAKIDEILRICMTNPKIMITCDRGKFRVRLMVNGRSIRKRCDTLDEATKCLEDMKFNN
jgi:hypothetical protein